MLPFDRDWLCQEPDGEVRLEGALPGAILAGSFNPLHAGHRRLADAAARMLSRSVAFEISVLNVDKPELPPEEIRRRLSQFMDLAPVFITRAPTFEQKARLFPGAILIIGSDTAERIIRPSTTTAVPNGAIAPWRSFGNKAAVFSSQDGRFPPGAL